jgi:hypothetical protein
MPADISRPVLRYHHEVVNARQLDILDELFAPDFINEATGFPPIIGVLRTGSGGYAISIMNQSHTAWTLWPVLP